MGITIDEDAYPIVLQGFPPGPKGEAALRDLFRRMSVISARAARDGTFHVVIAVGDEHFTAADRKVVGNCMAQATREDAARVVGAFAVIENGFARGVLTALRWLAPHAIAVIAAATPDEAVDLAWTRLHIVGVDVPPDVIVRARIAARTLHTSLREAAAKKSG